MARPIRWRATFAEGLLPDRLAGILMPLMYRPTGAVLGTSYVQYLMGLRDAGVEGAGELLLEIQVHGSVLLTFAE
jgi:hypothetical protein